VLRAYLEKAFADRFLPVVSTKDEGLEELFEKGKGMIEHYLSVLPADEKPIDLPRRFTVPLIDENGEALPRPLVGELDRWVESADGKVGVVDWKTAQARWSQDKIAKDDQATAYLLAGEFILGRRPSYFRYDLLLKTKKPEVERYFVARSETQTKRFIRKVKELDRALEGGAFMPNDQSFACATCPFKSRCEKWAE
jgi:CRISPR/Cas system-associated exonuclease Cas4 (RecB family)